MKILLVPKTFFGDIILTTPAARRLSQQFPNAELSVLVPPAAVPLVAGLAVFKSVIPFDRRNTYRGIRGLLAFAKILRASNFDRVYSFQRSYRVAFLTWLAGIPERIGFRGSKAGVLYTRKVRRDPSKHEVLRNLQLVADQEEEDTGLQESDAQAALLVPKTEISALSERVHEILLDSRPYIVLVPGSAWATKRWDWRGYQNVASHYIKAGMRVVLLGAPNETEICELAAGELPVINLAGKTTLLELVEIIRSARVLVCNDSMALHVASATGTPTVAIFCSTSPKFGFGPWNNRAVVVEKEGLFCKPCRRHGSKACPVGTYSCIRDLSAKQVVQAIDGLVPSEVQKC